MIPLLSRKSNPAQRAREAVRKKNWKKAIDHYEQQLKTSERDYGLWNLVGDLHAANKSPSQATEAWRRSLEGYALEGLYESVIGIARKVLRCAPEEVDIHLQIAEAYLDLEYYADSLGSFRSYLKLAKHRSEPDMKSYFKRLIESEVCYGHLLEEIRSLLKESELEDIELEKEVEEYVERMISAPQSTSDSITVESGAGLSLVDESTSGEEDSSDDPAATAREQDSGLAMLGGADGSSLGGKPTIKHSFEPTMPDFGQAPDLNTEFETPVEGIENQLPAGEGKDHYDLGVVYTEMSLWDAAIAEYENARRDPTYRHQATLGLANCYQNTNDLQKALNLLEAEQKVSSEDSPDHTELHYRLGEVYELLGQMEDALKCFEQIPEHSSSRGSAVDRIEGIRKKMLIPSPSDHPGAESPEFTNGQD